MEPTPNSIDRRTVLKTSLAAAAASVFSIGSSSSARANSPLIIDENFASAIDGMLVPRWEDPCPIFQPCSPLSEGEIPAEYEGVAVGDVLHGVAPEYHTQPDTYPTGWNLDKNDVPHQTQFYLMDAIQANVTRLPRSMGLETPMWLYEAIGPNGTKCLQPQFRFHIGQPALVRFRNKLPEELSIHMHGGHWPSHSDGHASFFTHPGEARDYYYPNVLPRIPGTDKPDISEAPSSMWFHDHAADMTAVHVARGLRGTAPCHDELECGLLTSGVLPGLGADSDIAAKPGSPGFPNPYDIWLAFGDAVFHPSGAIWYDSNDHNGYLGNVETVNGKAYPFLEVEARKYRFRMHGASTARHRRYRLSNNSTFLRIANDAWLFPKPQRVQALCLSPGKRADIIIDFSKFRPGTVIYLENILPQENERKPDGELDDAENPVVTGTPAFTHKLLKFIVTAPKKRNNRGQIDPNGRVYPNASITENSTLRPHDVIHDHEIVARRTLNFERKNGQWAINGSFYDERIANACPTLGTAEEWTIANGSGGWWHPVHIHLESHQQVKNTSTGKDPWYHNSFKQDTTMLGGNTSFTIRQRFRTFKGPFVFHCHTNEHEDLEMMFQVDPRAVGSLSPQTVQQFFP
jgi:FtsP/CotA-like multicopper oxidase with cupredoxin domain